jgi:exodeoxyribonuclease X
MSALIFDVETTDVEDPQVIELAFMGPLYTPLGDAETTLLNFKPTKPISLGALATHNIISDDLKDYPEWSGTWSLPMNTAFIVGHNIDYDWKAIGSPPNVKRICTLALARHVWPSLDSHKLTALIYHLYPHGMARELVKAAHNAAADVGLCYRLLGALYDAIGRPESWEKFWQISEKARVPTVFSFGKFKGSLISEVRKLDPSYIRWCLSGKCDIVNEDPYWQKALTQ